ncbi:hypothetical protein [Streptomyces luteireticuli]|uniref:Uncharacterized protein n=1 Tax=Streptomyces luteireticuli TaxID=173858 RepID=A0ABP3HZY7_9ACTN
MTSEPHGIASGMAYSDAPSLFSEVVWVRKYGRVLGSQDREFLLRKAAIFDRIAIKEAATFAPETALPVIEVAEGLARRLVEHDVAHAGLSLKGSELVCGDDYRVYVRQEYLAWSREQSS